MDANNTVNVKYQSEIDQLNLLINNNNSVISNLNNQLNSMQSE